MRLPLVPDAHAGTPDRQHPAHPASRGRTCQPLAPVGRHRRQLGGTRVIERKWAIQLLAGFSCWDCLSSTTCRPPDGQPTPELCVSRPRCNLFWFLLVPKLRLGNVFREALLRWVRGWPGSAALHYPSVPHLHGRTPLDRRPP